MANLEEDERLVDRWTPINAELQTLSDKLKRLSVEKDQDVESYKTTIKSLEETNAQQKEQVAQLLYMVKKDDEIAGKRTSRNLKSQRDLEDMRSQKEMLQSMRETRRSGDASRQPTMVSPRTTEQHTYGTVSTGMPPFVDLERGGNDGGNVNGGFLSGVTIGSEMSHDQIRTSENINQVQSEVKVLGQTTGMLANRLPPLAKYA